MLQLRTSNTTASIIKILREILNRTMKVIWSIIPSTLLPITIDCDIEYIVVVGHHCAYGNRYYCQPCDCYNNATYLSNQICTF